MYLLSFVVLRLTKEIADDIIKILLYIFGQKPALIRSPYEVGGKYQFFYIGGKVMAIFIMVSYSRSTYEKSKQFCEKLEELQKNIDPVAIRTYLGTSGKSKDENVELNLSLSDEEMIQLDELKALRKSGIQAEMKYALAQAKKNGIELSSEIVSGETLIPGFSKELLDKVPSLGVYNLFMLFTEKELNSYLQNNRKK